MALESWDVERADASSAVTEVALGIAGVRWGATATNLAPPSGYTQGRVGILEVPAGVRSLTVQVFGGMGGFMEYGGGTPNTPVMHTRHLPVEPGDELLFAPGGPAWVDNELFPTGGNGPFWGGAGRATPADYLYAGAGGGASALYVNDDLVAMSPGGGGWYGDVSADPGDPSAGTWTPPSSSYPTGSLGSESIGADGVPFLVPSGGGGGGTPGASVAASGNPGGNGAGWPVAPESGSEHPSPTWGQLGLSSGTEIPGRTAAGGVYVSWFIPGARRGFAVGINVW